MKENILAKIIEKRLELNYSQKYMAARLNITQSYYSKIEKGKNKITLQTALEIAAILNLETSEPFLLSA